MRATNMKNTISKTRLLWPLMVAMVLLLLTGAAPLPRLLALRARIFNLTRAAGFISQPDGPWSIRGDTAATYADRLCPGAITALLHTMQIPGPTLIVTQGQTVTVTLTNNLPVAAGNTSILFPGFQCDSTSGGVAGLLTTGGGAGGYGDLHVHRLVLPARALITAERRATCRSRWACMGRSSCCPTVHSVCITSGVHAASNQMAQGHWGEADFRLARAAYNHPDACYDREYLFQFSEIDPGFTAQAEAAGRMQRELHAARAA